MMDGDEKLAPTEMDRLLAALAARGAQMNGKPIAAENVLPLILSLMQENAELQTTVRVLKRT